MQLFIPDEKGYSTYLTDFQIEFPSDESHDNGTVSNRMKVIFLQTIQAGLTTRGNNLKLTNGQGNLADL